MTGSSLETDPERGATDQQWQCEHAGAGGPAGTRDSPGGIGVAERRPGVARLSGYAERARLVLGRCSAEHRGVGVVLRPWRCSRPSGFWGLSPDVVGRGARITRLSGRRFPGGYFSAADAITFARLRILPIGEPSLARRGSRRAAPRHLPARCRTRARLADSFPPLRAGRPRRATRFNAHCPPRLRHHLSRSIAPTRTAFPPRGEAGQDGREVVDSGLGQRRASARGNGVRAVDERPGHMRPTSRAQYLVAPQRELDKERKRDESVSSEP